MGIHVQPTIFESQFGARNDNIQFGYRIKFKFACVNKYDPITVRVGFGNTILKIVFLLNLIENFLFSTRFQLNLMIRRTLHPQTI